MSGDTSRDPLAVLLVEDHPAEVELIGDIARRCAVSVRLQVASDGEEALAQLADIGDSDAPDLVVLDLNLPRMDGRELLERLQADRALRSIPVVVFSSSSAADDVQSAYGAGASFYLVKPRTLADFTAEVERLFEFWSGAVLSPRPELPIAPRRPTLR